MIRVKSLRTKITLLFIWSCVLPFSILIIYITVMNVRDANNLLRRNIQLTRDDLCRQINEGIYNIETYFNMLYVNENVINIINEVNASKKPITLGNEKRLSDYASILYLPVKVEGFDRLLIIDQNGNNITVLSDNSHSMLLSAYPIKECSELAIQHDGRLMYSKSYVIKNTLDKNIVFHGVSRYLRSVIGSPIDPFKNIGTLILFFTDDFFFNSLSTMDDNINIVFYDETGNLILSSDPDIIQKNELLENTLREFSSNDHSNDVIIQNGFVMAKGLIDGLNYSAICYSSVIGLTNNTTSNAVYLFLLLAAICIFVIITLYYFVNKTLINPLSALSQGISIVSSGNFSVKVATGNDDELGRSINAFNHMTEDMRILIMNKISAEQLLHEEEIRALQAQLNPHFLFNTLGMARLLSMENKNEMTATLLELLSRLLRNTIRQLGCDITLAEEMKNIDDYITIQKIRYPDRFTIQYMISDDVLNISLPAMTLQPLLENAIIHGILPLKSCGKISVSASINNDSLDISIKDEGVGMSQQEIDALYQNKSEYNRNHSIGFYNVNKILQLKYGIEYGICVKSILKEYTVITVKIPINRIEDT